MGRKTYLLDLTPLMGRPGAVEEFEVPPTTVEEDDFQARIGALRIRATNCGASIRIEGRFSSRVPLECSRCLTTFEETIAQPIDESIPIRFGGPQAEELEAADEYDVSILRESRLDVVELVRQEILTALPMIPLCSPECPGLCPTCGEPKGSCACRQPKEEEPKTELRRLLANAFRTEDERGGSQQG
jgi:uncharacterized metal-binding protein YceD (DUF177 family)